MEDNVIDCHAGFMAYKPFFDAYETEIAKRDRTIKIMLFKGIIFGISCFLCGLGLGILIVAR